MMAVFARLAGEWPGKSAGPDGVEHPAIHHMLDVAAVAEHLVAGLPFPEPVKDALVVLAGLHDLGKINTAFRRMLRTGHPQTAGVHWEVSEALLRVHDARLAQALGNRERHREALYGATAGHHGRPPQRDMVMNRAGTGPGGDWRAMLDAAGDLAISDAGEAITVLLGLWPEASLDALTKPELAPLTWRLAGLVTLADWIGSNPAWFPPIPPGPGPAEYLDSARARVAMALQDAGLTAPKTGEGQLYSFPPRPMQAACRVVDLPDGPVLALIEDETGSGKTEAALILAQRLLLRRKGTGLYFALPTMATADAMFARVADVLPRLFSSPPSLTLAHGRAQLSKPYRDLSLARDRNPDEPGPTAWLMDSRRRALLANVGVGTVDQALLAVVRARHAALRQFGLASKILIVDEVHEMGDPYMGALLADLLLAHSAQGGSAILMSATLDLGLRDRLAGAFAAGAGRPAVLQGGVTYPALTVPGVVAPAIATRPSPRGRVVIKRLPSADSAYALLEREARRGAACVLIRNAVDEAIAAVADLRWRGVPADLLHARYTLHDRKRHEAAALAAFGKGRAARPGRILVATQVVEASLDLDFDVMVSDLAPMAALIQRAGRLWRHMDLRPKNTRPVPDPVLHVLGPDPASVSDDRWGQAELGRGAHVYPVALLWRTARALFATGAIRAPEGLRALIEATHGAEAPDVPESLLTADIRAEGEAGAARAHAAQNRIDWAAGYRRGAAGAGDADYPTRLGRPQLSLVLMRGDLPWSGGDWSVESAQLSEVSAAASRLSALPLPGSEPPKGLPDWLTATRRFCPVGGDGTICEGLSYHPDIGLGFG